MTAQVCKHGRAVLESCAECNRTVGNPFSVAFARRDGVDETAVRSKRNVVERHPHMHGTQCDVCRVLEAVAYTFPCDEKGMRDRRYECRYCQRVFTSPMEAADAANHDGGCAYGLAKALRAIYA